MKVNSNLCILGGKDIFENSNAKIKEYRMRWQEYPEKFYVGPFPLFIDIESTSACNLRCTFCYNRERIKGGMIKFDLVRKIIDEGADNGLYGVKFNFRGEPLLHPQIHEFVKYAKDKGLVDVYFNTNALKLNEEAAMKLISAGLDRITISFEGYTKEIYERYRVGSHFETVVRNVDNLIKMRGKLNAANPKVRIQAVLVPEVKTHLKEYEEFWLGRGADQAAYVDYQEREDKKGSTHKWICPQPWQRMCVSWDGLTSICSQDEMRKQTVGNATEMSIKEMWNSKEANRIRELHKKGTSHLTAGCLICPLRNSEIQKYLRGDKR